jgi:hypothetical protein
MNFIVRLFSNIAKRVNYMWNFMSYLAVKSDLKIPLKIIFFAILAKYIFEGKDTRK